MDRVSRQKINMETVTLNERLEQIVLKDKYRIVHPKSEECTFFTSTYGTFPMTDQLLDYRTFLHKFKETDIISNMFQIITV